MVRYGGVVVGVGGGSDVSVWQSPKPMTSVGKCHL